MRRDTILGLLALLAVTFSGCATATSRGVGLGSSRTRAKTSAPPQRMIVAEKTADEVAQTSSAITPITPGEHDGIFARPDRLARYFPDLYRKTPEAPKPATRSTWLGRHLKGWGQKAATASPTSMTYSTASRSSIGRTIEPGEVSVLPVSFNIPVDHRRDADVTPTRGAAGPIPDAGDSAPLAPARPESFIDTPPAPTEPEAPIVADEPQPPATPPASATPEPLDAPAAIAPDPSPSPALPEPTWPEVVSPPVAPEVVAPEVAPAPAAEPVVETSPPAAPVEEPTPKPDPRERPRMAAPSPRAKVAVAPPNKPARVAPAAPIAAPSKSIPGAVKDQTARKAPAAPKTVAARPGSQDPAVRAAKSHAEASHALGLPDPTLPTSYYRHDAPPIRGDAEVVATTAEGTAEANHRSGPCPHCGHDPRWRPSLQRFGRRVFGLGEFAPPQP